MEDIYNIAEHMKSLQKDTTLYSQILAFITGQLLCQGREKIKCTLTNPDGIKITASHQVISYRPANLQNMQIWRLGPQTWRFPKYVLNENKNGRFLVSSILYLICATYYILLPHFLKSQFLFHCRREAPV